MATEWYYQVMGEEVGPVSSSELERLADSGRIDRDTLVRKGAGGWIAADNVEGVFDPIPAPPQAESEFSWEVPKPDGSLADYESPIRNVAGHHRQMLYLIGHLSFKGFSPRHLAKELKRSFYAICKGENWCQEKVEEVLVEGEREFQRWSASVEETSFRKWKRILAEELGDVALPRKGELLGIWLGRRWTVAKTVEAVRAGKAMAFVEYTLRVNVTPILGVLLTIVGCVVLDLGVFLHLENPYIQMPVVIGIGGFLTWILAVSLILSEDGNRHLIDLCLLNWRLRMFVAASYLASCLHVMRFSVFFLCFAFRTGRLNKGSIMMVICALIFLSLSGFMANASLGLALGRKSSISIFRSLKDLLDEIASR